MEKKTKKTIGQKIDGFVNAVKAKKEAFKEKHPTAYKVIVGTTILVPVAVGGALAWNATHHDNNEDQTVDIIPLDSNSIDNWEQRRIEGDLKDWEEHQENWAKVLDVAKELNIDDNNDASDEYLIHGDSEGNVTVAHINGGDFHYPPENLEQTDEPTQEVEG